MNNILSAEQEKCREEFINRTKLVYSYHDRKLREEGFNPSNTEENFGIIFTDILTASNARIRLQTLQECLGMCKEMKHQGDSIMRTTHHSQKTPMVSEALGWNSALSTIAAKLSALIENEK